MSDGGVWVSEDSISWKKQKREWKTDKDDFTKWIDIFKMGEKWRMVCGDGRVFSSENPLGKWEETSERLVGGLKYPRFSVSAENGKNFMSPPVPPLRKEDNIFFSASVAVPKDT